MNRKNNFEFILNDKLNIILNRDFEDADIALNNNLYKSAAILYGGVIEAILKYFLLIDVYSNQKLKKYLKTTGNQKIRSLYERVKELGFDQIITLANKTKIIIEPGGFYLIKHFRNFVHIFKEYENEIQINKEIAITSKEFTNGIIKSLRKDWNNKIESGELFFTSKKAQYQETKNKPIIKLILEKLYKDGFVDFIDIQKYHPGKSLGALLANMNKWGVCQADPMSWSVKHKNFRIRIFNHYFDNFIKALLKI